MTDETDRLFSRLERNRFAQGNDPNSVLDGQQTGIGSINPSGFVSDLMQDGTGKVVNDGSGILVKDADDVERVRMGHLGSNDYGLRVTSPSGTTIIDGTSNIFKIAATGTVQTASFTGPGEREAEVTLATGFTYVPMFTYGAQWNTVFGANSGLDITWDVNTGGLLDSYEGEVELVNTDETLFRARTSTARSSPAAVARNYRYYILQETAF